MSRTKEERKEYNKAYYQAHKEQCKAKKKAYYQAHKEEHKAHMKAYYQAHKEQAKACQKAWIEANKEDYKSYQKAYQKVYTKSELNSLGKTKHSIRMKSQSILKKSGIKIPGYEIHHCFTYNDPSKFIYCSREMHKLIHAYLRQHNIDADSNHYDYIKHLLDEKVVTFGI